MDGTLTVPCIDFAAMRRKAGVHPIHGDILDEVAKMSPERQAKARAAILEVEEQVRKTSRTASWSDLGAAPRSDLSMGTTRVRT